MGTMLGRVVPAVAALTMMLPATSVGAAAGAPTYAPVDQPGPSLSVSPTLLAEALACIGNLRHGTHTPILLVPGTTVTPVQDFSWNWERSLAAQSWPFCTVTLPGSAMGDIQVAGEYVVYAIRTMHQVAGRRIEIVGHSQGGMVPRWALRFWPDTRQMVDDVVGLAPSNHGTPVANGACIPDCAPAIWQQRSNANFIAALNSRQETFSGISHTVVYTHADEVLPPNLNSNGTSSLHTGGGAISNIAIQDVCPLDVADHIGVGSYDNTAYAIAIDALTHQGPAAAARVGRSVCLKPLQPGVNPLTFATDYTATLTYLATTLATYPHVPSEPPLACYVTASCPK